MRRVLPLFVLAALLAREAHAGGVIPGRVWPSRAAARSVRPERGGALDFLFGRRERPLPPLPAQADLADAVITVRAIPEAAERRLVREATAAFPRLAFERSRFVPRVTAVVAGTALELENRDALWHEAFSASPQSHFGIAPLGPGAVRVIPLPNAGVVNVHCDLHPDEVGYVVVAPNHAFARADSLGNFALPKLPAGEYEVTLWHPRRGSRVTRMVVPRRGGARCDLAF